MGQKKWNGVNTSYGTGSNWDPVGVPQTGDDVIFDATSTQDCTLDVAPASLGSLDIQNAYGTGHFDANGEDVTVTGAVTFDNSTGTVSMGTSSIWTIGGSFDYLSVGTLVKGTSTVVMTGGTSETPVNLIGHFQKDLKNLTIALGATVTTPSAANQPQFDGVVLINGGLEIPTGEEFTLNTPGDLQLSSTGSITGGGTIFFNVGTKMTVCEGTFNPGSIQIQRPESIRAFDSVSPWQCDVLVTDSNSATNSPFLLKLSGTVDITGSLTVRAENVSSVLEITNSTNDPDFLIGGDVSLEGDGTVTWDKGTGTITLNGDAAQSVDFADQSVEAIIIASSDTVTFDGGWTATSFSAESGDFDPNGQTLETVGGFAIASGVNLLSSLADADLWDGVALTVGGSFAAQGNPGDDCNLQGDGGWTLDATAAGTVNNAAVSGCDADVGVDITARNSLDGTGNSSWIFQDSGGAGLLLGMI